MTTKKLLEMQKRLSPVSCDLTPIQNVDDFKRGIEDKIAEINANPVVLNKVISNFQWRACKCIEDKQTHFQQMHFWLTKKEVVFQQIFNTFLIEQKKSYELCIFVLTSCADLVRIWNYLTCNPTLFKFKRSPEVFNERLCSSSKIQLSLRNNFNMPEIPLHLPKLINPVYVYCILGIVFVTLYQWI